MSGTTDDPDIQLKISRHGFLGHFQVAEQSAFRSLGAERTPLDQLAQFTSSQMPNERVLSRR